jgi:hypothetical protein
MTRHLRSPAGTTVQVLRAAEPGLIVCPWFRIGGSIVRTIALTARFDHAADVTLDELRAELIYPLDEQADRFFRSHDGGGTDG